MTKYEDQNMISDFSMDIQNIDEEKYFREEPFSSKSSFKCPIICRSFVCFALSKISKTVCKECSFSLKCRNKSQ